MVRLMLHAQIPVHSGIGRGGPQSGRYLAELSAGSASLEDAFFRLTSQATDYRGVEAS
jgi:ABC-2 type transport system ATP-binding protein